MTQNQSQSQSQISQTLSPDVKDQWCSALRSGQYKKGRFTLYHDGHYCCLGVLAEILHGKSIWQSNTTHFGIMDKNGNLISHLIPHEYCPSGLTDENQVDLSNLNDRSDYSFLAIASWIEDNL